MPEDLDPRWEYAEIDPEIYEAVYGVEIDGLHRLPFHEDGNIGFRFGSGHSPDSSTGVCNEEQEITEDCRWCGKVIGEQRFKGKYCSRICGIRGDNDNTPRTRVDCKQCKRSFIRSIRQDDFCSAECGYRYVKTRGPEEPPGRVSTRTRPRGTRAECPGCCRVKTMFRRGVCRNCYRDRNVRFSACPVKRYRTWSAEEAGRLFLWSVRPLPIKVITTRLTRSKNEVVCKRQWWKNTGRVSTNLLKGDRMAESPREVLPPRRRTVSQKIRIAGQTVHYSIGLYPDGRPGELWIEVAKAGAALRNWAGEAAMMVSIALQHGVPLTTIVDLFLATRNDPCGKVEGHDRITFCTSIMDCIVRDLAVTFLGREDLVNTSEWSTVPVPISDKTELPPPTEGQTCVCHNERVGSD